MSSLVVWMLIITVGVCATILSAAAQMPVMHMTMTGLISLVIALIAIRENRQLVESGASKNEIAASTARYMGLVWAWGAVALFVTYNFILQWKEWWHFFMAFAVLSVLCIFLANSIGRDENAGKEDKTILTVGRYLTVAQLVGMMVTVAGLLIDGKMVRYQTPRFTDWAANNIFFFGALALAAISFNALRARDEVAKR
ncbi:MAG: hypothetical protein AB1749_08980 [Pseudomonadota bacterium]